MFNNEAITNKIREEITSTESEPIDLVASEIVQDNSIKPSEIVETIEPLQIIESEPKIKIIEQAIADLAEI